MVNTIERFALIIKDIFLCMPTSIQAMFITAFTMLVLVAVIKLVMR